MEWLILIGMILIWSVLVSIPKYEKEVKILQYKVELESLKLERDKIIYGVNSVIEKERKANQIINN